MTPTRPDPVPCVHKGDREEEATQIWVKTKVVFPSTARDDGISQQHLGQKWKQPVSRPLEGDETRERGESGALPFCRGRSHLFFFRVSFLPVFTPHPNHCHAFLFAIFFFAKKHSLRDTGISFSRIIFGQSPFPPPSNSIPTHNSFTRSKMQFSSSSVAF